MTLSKLHTSSISGMIEDDDNNPSTPKAPRGRRSDLTEKDMETFTQSFSMAFILTAGHLE